MGTDKPGKQTKYIFDLRHTHLLLLVVGKRPVRMADNVDSVDSTAAVVGVAAAVVDAGIPAMPPGTAGIAGTAACIVGLPH